MGRDLTDKEKLEQVFGIHDSEESDIFEAWTNQRAETIAQEQGLALTSKHWEVIDFLRVLYQNEGADMPPVHELSQTLDERFFDEGGLKYLFSLFPGGPLNQGCRIAGVPVPDDALDPSFGSIH